MSCVAVDARRYKSTLSFGLCFFGLKRYLNLDEGIFGWIRWGMFTGADCLQWISDTCNLRCPIVGSSA